MKQTIILWAGAFIITFLAGYLQSVMSSSYPVSGTIGINAKKVSYRFDKISNTHNHYKVVVRTDIQGLDGHVMWRNKYPGSWNKIPMKQKGDLLQADLPGFNLKDTIEYKAAVLYNGKEYMLPAARPVKMSFKGKLPSTVTVLYFLTLFGGLLLSTRSGLEYFKVNNHIRRLSLITLIPFFLYTLAVHPLKKTYELEVLNNRVAGLTELFDLQSLLFLVLWIAGMIFAFKIKTTKLPVAVISILTLLVFLFIKL